MLADDLRTLRDRPLAPVQVALLDTGVDAAHPDLRGRVESAFRVTRSRGRYAVERWTASAGNDEAGHGTGVASVIAAVAPNARIVDIRIADSEREGRGEALLAGLRLACERRVPVLNVSLCCDRKFLAPLTEICEAAYARSQVIVAAQDNTPAGEKGLPAELSSVLGVDCDLRAPIGSLRYRPRHRVEFSAGGKDVPVAAAAGKRAFRSGTSFATAYVSGLCALLRGAYPELTPFELKSVLKDAAERAGEADAPQRVLPTLAS